MALPPKPSNAAILAWLEQERRREERLTKASQEEEDLYFQQFELEAADGYKAIRLGTAPADVDQAVEAIQPANYVAVKVEQARDTKEWAALADSRSKWCRALIAHWRKDEDILAQLLWGELVQRRRIAFVGYDPLPPEAEFPPKMERGESLESYLARLDAWALKKQRHVPITFDLKPLGTAFGMEQQGRLVRVWEDYERTVADLHYWYPPERFPAVATLTAGLDPMQTVTFTAYWDDHWRAAYVNGQPIFPTPAGTPDHERGIIRNEYGICPFVQFYFRKLPTDGGDRQFRGFLSNSKDAYRAESEMASQYLAITSRAAWPVIKARLHDGRKIEMGPGKVFYLKPGEDFEEFAGQGPLPQVGEAWDRMRMAIRQNALGAASGQMPPGIRSAMALSMITGVDRNKIMPALRELARGLTQALTIAEIIVEQLHRAPVTLPAGKPGGKGRQLKMVTLKPDDVRGWYEKQVQFGPQFGPDVLQRFQGLANLWAQGALWKKKMWELMPEIIDSVTDAEQEQIQEKSDSHPLMTQAHVIRRLKDYDPESLAFLVQMGTFSAGPGGPGGSGGPPGAENSRTGSPPRPDGPGRDGATLQNFNGAQPGAPTQVGQAQAGMSPNRTMGGLGGVSRGGRSPAGG